MIIREVVKKDGVRADGVKGSGMERGHPRVIGNRSPFLLGICFILHVIMSGAVASEQAKPWTWQYSTVFQAQEAASFHEKKQLSFVQLDTPLFTQLIVSWNASKPANGHYSVWVQGRNSKTQHWLPLHHMLDWGATWQRTYISKCDDGSGCHHVRLEIPKSVRGDGFRIRIEAHDGADLAQLKGLFVCLADFSLFEVQHDSYAHLKSIKIENVPAYSQMVLNHPRAQNLCSPTSMSMLLSYILKTPVDPLLFAQGVYDSGLDSFGSWPFNVAHAFVTAQEAVTVYATRLPSFETLYQRLRNDIPVMVSVRGALQGAAKEYTNGHLLLVTGWDHRTKQVLCHDPAFASDKETVVRYDIRSFLEAWGRSHNFAYLVEPVGKALV